MLLKIEEIAQKPSTAAPTQYTLSNFHKWTQAHTQIQRDNERMLSRLQHTPSVYSAQGWEAAYSKQQQIKRNICRNSGHALKSKLSKDSSAFVDKVLRTLGSRPASAKDRNDYTTNVDDIMF